MPTLDHPKRGPLLDELHARAAPRLQAPTRVVHLALKQPNNAANRDRSLDLTQLANLAAQQDISSDTRHHVFTRGPAEVTWESHTEYVAYTAVIPDPTGPPFGDDAADLFPVEWEQVDVADRIAAVHLEVLRMPADPQDIVHATRGWLDPASTMIMTVLGGAGVLAGDFRADEAGFTRFALFVSDQIGPGRLGRTVQRVLDLETYRSLAMIGFLRSRDLSARLNELDPRLLDLVEHLDESDRPDDDVLRELLSVTAELETLAAAHDFRFGATGAYAAIVEDRLTALGDERFSSRQTFREFLSRRYLPAIRTAEAAEARLTRMQERASRASELLRTKVDVARSAQNQNLLKSMDDRAETQLRLQHTVEGLSVVAISYYAVGLLAYVFSPFAEEHGIDHKWLMAALVPLVVVSAWLGMRWVRSRIHRHQGEGG